MRVAVSCCGSIRVNKSGSKLVKLVDESISICKLVSNYTVIVLSPLINTITVYNKMDELESLRLTYYPLRLAAT